MSIYEIYQLDIDSAQLLFDIIGTIALVFTLWLYLRQLRIMQNQLEEAKDSSTSQLKVMQNQLEENRKSSTSQNLLTLIDFLQSKEVREARERVMKRLQYIDYEKWTEKDKVFASTVASSYGSAGVILQTGALELSPIIKSWGYSIKKSYEILKPHIEEMREVAGDGYWSAFDWLMEKVIEAEKANTANAI
jgi:hypothetical protein